MLVDKFMKFLKKQDSPFPCGIHKDWIEVDGGVINVNKLEQFLKDIEYEGFQRGQAEMGRILEDKREKEDTPWK